jgi:hypothetical protein
VQHDPDSPGVENAQHPERGKIEIGKGLAKSIRPCVGEERIVLRPANAGRRCNRHKRRRFALHHGDATAWEAL